MSLRASLKNLIRRDPAASLRDRAAATAARVEAFKSAAAPPAANHAEQVAQAGLTGDVLAACGIDHRDGTVSYADAMGRVTRRPLASWINFSAQQMHSRVQSEIGRRRVLEAGDLSAEEHADWEARIRRELRTDAVHALTFRHDRAFEAAQAIRSGVEPSTQTMREQSDVELMKLAPLWEAAVDIYQQRTDEEAAIAEAASGQGWPGAAPADAGPEWRAWFQKKEEWRERTGVAAAEDASGEAGIALHEIEIQIADLSAASLAGLKLKARVAQRSEDIGVTWPEGLGEGLTRDLLAFGADGLTDENPAGDALLLQLGRQFEAARAREIAACEACNVAQAEAGRHMPERPAALRFRASDHPLRLGKYLTHPDHLEGVEVTADDIAWMKRKPYVREVRRPVRHEDNLPPDARTVVDTFPWPEAQERADEIVTAWDAWQAESLRIHGEYVTEALDNAANDAGNIATDLALRIADLPAHTAAGLRVKLRALACYNPSFFYLNPPELPDEDRALAHSLWRDVQNEAAPAIEPKAAFTPPAEPSPVFVTIADGTRSAADDALSDPRVSPDLRKAVEEHRDATLAMLLETDESNEATDAQSAVVEQTGAALRAVSARSLADVRCKLAFLLPEILPDVNGTTPSAFLQNICADVDRLAAQSHQAPAPDGQEQAAMPYRPKPSLAGMVDFASASLNDLQSLHDLADLVGGVAYATVWSGRCKARGPGDNYNAAGKLMQWLGDALTDVETAAINEARRRNPTNSSDRKTRLEMLALPVIQNGDPDETAAFAGEIGAHAVAELAGR